MSLYQEDLTHHNGATCITGLPISPSSLYVYWSVGDVRRRLITDHFLTNWHAMSLGLYVYDVTDVWFDGYNAPLSRTVQVSSNDENWYFYDLSPDRNYVVDLGTPIEDKIFTLLRSSPVSLPPQKDGPFQPGVRFTQPLKPPLHPPQQPAKIPRPPSADEPVPQKTHEPSQSDISPITRFDGEFDGYHLVDPSCEPWLRSDAQCQKDT